MVLKEFGSPLRGQINVTSDPSYPYRKPDPANNVLVCPDDLTSIQVPWIWDFGVWVSYTANYYTIPPSVLMNWKITRHRQSSERIVVTEKLGDQSVLNAAYGGFEQIDPELNATSRKKYYNIAQDQPFYEKGLEARHGKRNRINSLFLDGHVESQPFFKNDHLNAVGGTGVNQLVQWGS